MIITALKPVLMITFSHNILKLDIFVYTMQFLRNSRNVARRNDDVTNYFNNVLDMKNLPGESHSVYNACTMYVNAESCVSNNYIYCCAICNKFKKKVNVNTEKPCV